MKARTTNCVECRKAVYKEAETAYIKEQYIFRIPRIAWRALPCAEC